MNVGESFGVTASTNPYQRTWDLVVQEQLNSLKMPGPSMGTRIRDEWHEGGPISLPRDNHLLEQHEHRRSRIWPPMLAGMVTFLLLSPFNVWYVFGVISGTIVSTTIIILIWRERRRETSQRAEPTPVQCIPRAGVPYGKERIGDVERDQVIAELTVHFMVGRMKRDEFEIRMGHVLDSVTAEDLSNALRELPMLTHDELQAASNREWVRHTNRFMG